MKTIFFFFALSCAALGGNPTNEAVMTGTQTQTANGQKIFHSSGNQGTPLVGWSQSGASAAVFTQDSPNFENPAVVIQRNGTDGDSTTTPTLLVLAGKETAWNQPVLKAGGCLALSGDNYLIFWGNGGLSVPGGIYDNTGSTIGKISIDPAHRQLTGPDGITCFLDWSQPILKAAPGVTISPAMMPPGALAHNVAIPANSTASGKPGDFSFDSTHLYLYTGDGTTHKWLKISGANLF